MWCRHRGVKVRRSDGASGRLHWTSSAQLVGHGAPLSARLGPRSASVSLDLVRSHTSVGSRREIRFSRKRVASPILRIQAASDTADLVPAARACWRGRQCARSRESWAQPYRVRRFHDAWWCISPPRRRHWGDIPKRTGQRRRRRVHVQFNGPWSMLRMTESTDLIGVLGSRDGGATAVPKSRQLAIGGRNAD